MSRSFKKTPVIRDTCGARWFYKRQANKKVRKYSDIQSGSSYKRKYCSYNICDYRFYRTLGEYLRPRRDYGSHKRTAYYWMKCYRWK